MTQERLTRHEISWLLAQEARGAAKTLRDEVVIGERSELVAEPGLQPVESTLDALDEAIEMLSALNTGRRGKPARRGRIDLASLLYEIAPNARIAIEPGAGTEVLGEEADLRRMLSVLVTQAAAGGASETEVAIRRQGDSIKISVELGPDVAAGGELERRWLARMAIRHGGRVELEGGTQSVFLQADGASDQREVTELRRELEQAQQLGEAYARELATMLAAGELRTEPPSHTPRSEESDRLATLRGVSASLERTVRPIADALRAEAAQVQSLAEGAELGHVLSRRAQSLSELASELASLAECPTDEPAEELELSTELLAAERSLAYRTSRDDVQLSLQCSPTTRWRAPRSLMQLLFRMLLTHAVNATPRGGSVRCSVFPTELGLLVTVEDGGPSVPEGAGAALVSHQVDPTQFGRPGGISLMAADAVARALGGELTLRPGAQGATETWVTLSVS
ncbi:MAG TPA: ATP-binding protein [Polyangiaceae bacterium]